MGNDKGLLGRGIYFADDPNKPIRYDGCDGIILIFAVLLGDCLLGTCIAIAISLKNHRRKKCL